MKVFILTTILAPYRIDYFNELGKYCELTVCFETEEDSYRNNSWYKKEFFNFEVVFLEGWDQPQSRIKKDLLKYIRITDYDIAVAFEYSTPTSLLFMLLNIVKRKPYCINVDGGFITHNIAKSAIKRFFIKRAAACLASGKIASDYFKYYGAKSERIFIHTFSSLFKSDIVDKELSPNEKQSIKSELNIPLQKTVIAVGQFFEIKGIDILIKAWKSINSDYNLLIVGSGEKEKEYISMINDYKLKNVKILGFKQKDELKKYYMASDLFVLPTRGDVWGLVINEAMAYGLPVITTDRCVAGLELIENDENGYIVSVGDEKMLSHKINMLLQDDALREKMSKKNIDKISSYTIENMAKANYETFMRLIR